MIKGNNMKKILITLALLTSLNVSAVISTTESEINQLAQELRYLSADELGSVLTASCVPNGYELDCTFTYDLPDDFCWYGYYEAKASYFLDHHGALVVHEDFSIEWKE
jgi:hypothetical protein